MKVGVLSDTPLFGDALGLVRSVLKQVGADVIEFHSLESKPKSKLTAAQARPYIDDVRRWARRHDRILVIGRASTTIALYAGDTDEKTLKKEFKALQPPTKHRGRMFWFEDVPTVVTIDPVPIITKSPDTFRDLAFDCAKLVEQDEPLPHPDDLGLEFAILETPDEVDEWLSDLMHASVVSLDAEMTGFVAQDEEMLCLGLAATLADGSITGCVIPAIDLTEDNEVVQHDAWHGSLDRIREFLDEYEGVLPLHNLKFDLQHLWDKVGDFEISNPADTMLMHYALDERPAGKTGVHGLKKLARVYFDAPDYEVPMGKWLEEFFRVDDPDGRAAWEVKDRERWPKKWERIDSGKQELVVPAKFSGPPSLERRTQMLNELFMYQFLDCYYTLRLYYRLLADIEEEDAERPHGNLKGLVFDHLTPASVALAAIEYGGVPIDHEWFEDLRTQLEIDLAEQVEEIKVAVQKLHKQEINPYSDDQLRDYLYDTCGFKPVTNWRSQRKEKSTDRDSLKQLVEQAEKKPHLKHLIKSIMEFRNTQKILGTYVLGILKACDRNGVLHPDFFLHGTVTGRLSCNSPNLQNIPGEARSQGKSTSVGEVHAVNVRRGFIAPRGYRLIEADYSQLELAVGAQFSEDPTLLETFRTGADVHEAVGREIWAKDEKLTHAERMMAKMINFGIFYGRGAESIANGPEMEHLKATTGEKWSEKDVQRFFDGYRENFAGLFGWIDEQHEHALTDHEVTNPFGRVRRFPFVSRRWTGKIKRQATNAPIQSSASDVTLSALVRIHAGLDPEQARVILTVHDSILVLSKVGYVDEAVEIIRYEMEDNLPELPEWFAPDGWIIPLKADIGVGRHWADTK